MVKTARCIAPYQTRFSVGDNDRNPFITQGYSFNPREESELANEVKKARLKKLKKLRRAANGEEAND